MLGCRSGYFLFILVVSLGFIISNSSMAAEVNGIIDTDTVWTLAESPYQVTGNIQIAAGTTLTIESGVSVTIQSSLSADVGYYILVEGVLNAQGTVDNPIVFTAADPLSPWGGIVFVDQSQDWDETGSSGSILSNCVIEYAGNSTPYGSACIYTFSAQPMIRNNTIRYGSNIAITATDILQAQSLSGNLNILSNRIHDHTVGIQLNLEGARIENNFFINLEQAIVMRTSSNDIDIENNTIVNPQSDLPGDGLNLIMDADENDNGVKAYLWTQTSGVAIELEDPNSPFGTFTAPNVGANVETLVFDLAVTDDDGLQQTETIEVLVVGTNEPPVANAGTDITVETGLDVQLSAAASFDPDKGIATYLWEQTDGAPQGLLPSASVPDPTFTAPAVAPEGEILTFQVTVTDTEGLTDTDTLEVLVWDTNIPPTAESGTDSFVYKEVTVRLDGSNSTDPDGSIATHTWVQTAGTGVILENADTSRPSFETPQVGESGEDLVFELTVTDNEGLQSVDTVTYTVFGENIPPFSVPAATATVLQGDTVILSGFESFDLDRRAEISMESNFINCTNEDAGSINVNLSEANAGYLVGIRSNHFQTASGGGLAVYLYDWPSGITEPDISLSDNWYGTTESEAIDALIFDGGEDFNLPVLTHAPTDTAPTMVGSTLTYPSLADAGPDITASADVEVTLDGSDTYDPEGIATYTWTQIEGPNVNLKEADGPKASFIAPLGGDAGQTLRFELQVKVGDAYHDIDEAGVTVTADEDPPTIDLDDWPTCFIASIKYRAW